jgi:hypothetical protein
MDGPDGQENREFYRQVQAESVRKKCQGCGNMVSLRPQYGYCNSCADAREKGYDC